MKVKIRKNILILILVLLFAIIGVICFITIKNQINSSIKEKAFENIRVNIEQRKYNKIGDNLYYTNELIENKGIDEESILKYYQIISDFVKENFDCDIYISNLNYDVGKMYFNGYQMINEIIIEDVYFTITIQDNNVQSIDFLRDQFINEDIEKNNLLSVEEMNETASNVARENADAMLNSSNIDDINGEGYFKYDETDGVYYNVDLNHGSYIKINPKKGNVIHTYFFNGIIID